MTGDQPEPTIYVNEHVKEKLLRDPRVAELDIYVAIDGAVVVVTGHVSTTERRDAIDEVIGELLPDHEIRNDTSVSVYPEAPEEVLP